MVKVLVCDPIHEDGVRKMREAGFQVDVETELTPEELIARVGDYDALVVRSGTKVTRKVLEEGKRLKAVARAGVGLDNIDLEAARERGVTVFNTPEAPSNAVAELVLGLVLAVARGIPHGDAGLKAGRWEKKKLMGFELSGKTLGVIGFGRIGYALARKAVCLGMRVLAYDVVLDKLMDHVREAGAEASDMDTLLRESHIVSIHVPLLPQTRHLIGREEIAKMRRGAILVNASRGGVVDEEALMEALDSGHLAGAALDVFESEPHPNPRLVGRSNVVCTPHIGSQTVEAQRANGVLVARKLVELLGGGES